MGRDARKPVLRVSNKGRLKPVSSATETSKKFDFAHSKPSYGTFQKANNKDADQTAHVLFAHHRRQVFLRRGPYNIKCISIRLDIIMEANTMDPAQTAPLWEQSDLGPYCLQYKLEHKADEQAEDKS